MALPTKKPLSPGAMPWAGAGARPHVLGRYHVLDEIGRNVVGPLYLARLEGPKGFQRWAAIRRVDKRHLAEASYAQRFYERVRAGAKLLHPNVTALFDVGEEDGAPWVAMEYLHGERLEDAIGRLELADTPASWEIAARVIADAAEGLHAVHSLRDKEGAPLGLLHGDLAPHSLALTFDGKTKIKGAFEPRVHGVLDPRKVPYAAPEQLFDGVVDARADVFALGVLLWELLAGKRLFARETDDETRAMIEAGVVPPLGDLVEDVPRELDALVRRALMRDPGSRFSSARELSRELEGLLVARGVVARDDDVGRYMRTLFADRYADQEAALQAAADVTEVFRKSQQIHAFSPRSLPDVSPRDAEVEETELMARPSEDDDHTTAERPVARPAMGRPPPKPVSGYTDEILADSGPTIPRNQKLPLNDTDEVPTITAAQPPVVLPVPADRISSSEELTLTAARPEPPVKVTQTGGVSTSRLIMPSSLESDADVTESAIFVAPRIPAPTPPENAMSSRPPPVPPPRALLPSFPDRPLLPSTPATGVGAYGRSQPPPPMHASAPPPAYFMPPPAFTPPASRGPHLAMSTASLRAVLFPQERSKRIAMVSIVGFAGGAVLFLAFFIAWRISTSTAQQPAPPPTASAMAPVATAAAPATATSTATVMTTPAPAETQKPKTVPPIPTLDLSQPAHPRMHHHVTVAATHAPPVVHENAAPSAGKTGFLTVMCRPDACDHIVDGGHDLGGSPLFRQELPAGKHMLTLRVDSSHAQKVVPVDVVEGQTVTIHPEFGP